MAFRIGSRPDPDQTTTYLIGRRVLCAGLAICLLVLTPAAQTSFDIIIRGGRVIDGSGNPWVAADIGIVGDRITRIGDLSSATAGREILAAGLAVAPGFIDPHTHARRGIFKVPTADNALLQGVTTLTEGNDGSWPLPVGRHLERIVSTGISPNWAVFVGQGTVRSAVTLAPGFAAECLVISDLDRDTSVDVTIAAAADLTMEIVERGGARAIYHAINEEDVERIMQHPAAAVGSDGGVSVFGDGVPHPREYGTFARVLSRYVRERGLLTLEEAVRKMSSATAQRLGIRDHGQLREESFADIVVFDPDEIRDLATFEEPHQYAVGVRYVLVNGVVVVDKGEHTGARPGRVIHGPGHRE